MRRPNILLITADQWRGDSLGIAGHPVVKTPNIDRLAGEGTYFARHYAQATPCAPARACLYTGLYQMTNRVVRNGAPLDDRHDNIARMARRAGYAPTLFGYTDQAIDPRTTAGADPRLNTYEGVLPGFTERLSLTENAQPWLSWLKSRGHEIPADPMELFLPSGGASERPSNSPARYGQDETLAAFLTGEFLRWLDERPSGDPWFAHISFLNPHPPFVVPEPYNAMYDPDLGSPFARAADPSAEGRQHPMLDHRLRKDTRSPAHVVGAGDGLVADWDEADFRAVRATYWGMISEVDAQLGRLFDGLRSDGVWDDTLIVLTSDHGEMMGDHFSLGKFGYFDPSYHIPLIIRDPARPDGFGKRIEALTEAVDLVPTIMDAAGLEVPDHLDGQSLNTFLDGSAPMDWRQRVHWEYDFRAWAADLGRPIESCSMSVIRDDRFKYVHFADWPPLLFDLSADPGELTNLAEDPAFRDTRLDKAEALLSWRARHLDRRLTAIELTPDGPVVTPR